MRLWQVRVKAEVQGLQEVCIQTWAQWDFRRSEIVAVGWNEPATVYLCFSWSGCCIISVFVGGFIVQEMESIGRSMTNEILALRHPRKTEFVAGQFDFLHDLLGGCGVHLNGHAARALCKAER